MMNTCFRSNHNLALQWMYGVRNLKQTHYMFPNMMKVSVLVDQILNKYDLNNCIFAELYNYMNFNNTLTWRFGSPNTNLYLFTPNRMYIEKINPFLNLWRDCDIDENIIQISPKYKQSPKILDLPSSYNLFLMQDSMGDEQIHLDDAIEYAKSKKVYTVFKQHPLTNVELINNNEYVIFADANYNLDHLLINADKVFSSWSSVGLNAMLAGKSTATYDVMSYSEILPRIKTAYELENIEPVKSDDLYRFLTWFNNQLCIDVTKEGFEDRIEKRIVDFSKGLNVIQ